LLKVLFHFQDTKFRQYISQQVLASGLATGSSLASVVVNGGLFRQRVPRPAGHY